MEALKIVCASFHSLSPASFLEIFLQHSSVMFFMHVNTHLQKVQIEMSPRNTVCFQLQYHFVLYSFFFGEKTLNYIADL